MLTPEEVVQFREEGYLVFSGAIPEDRVAIHWAVLDDLVVRSREMTENEKPYWSLELDGVGDPIAGLLHKVQGACIAEPRILDLASEPAILDRVETLIGPDIDLFGTKFFPKLPGGGTSTGWHQDNFYFGTTSDQIISCATYLEDANEKNGCLQVVPRSHKSGHIVEHEKRENGYGSWTKVDNAQAVTVEVSAGSFALFSANLLHGALDNVSDRSRYSTAWHYMPSSLNPERFLRGVYEDRFTVRKA